MNKQTIVLELGDDSETRKDEEEENPEYDSDEGFWRYWLKETIAARFYCLGKGVAKRHR